MKRQVTLTKTIDCEDKTCGACMEFDFEECMLFTKKNGLGAQLRENKAGAAVRCKACLAAEEAAKA